MSESLDNNKRIARNTVLLYFRSLFLLVISLYTSRIILEALGVHDYGIYNVVGGVVAMFTILSNTMASASQRFITFAIGENDFNRLTKVFTTSRMLHVLLGIIIIILIEIFGVWFLYNKLNIPTSRIDAAFWVLQFSTATLYVNITSVPFNAIIIAHERMSVFAYISILDGILKLLVAYLLFISDVDKLILYALLIFAVSLLSRIIYGIYCHKQFQETRNKISQIDIKIFKEMFSFSGWNLFGNGSAVLRNQGIDILLNIAFGVTVNAAKGVCNQVQAAVYQFVTNFQTAVNPQLTKSVAQNDFNRTHTLIFQGGRFSFYLLSLFAVPIVINTFPILSFWLKEVPQYAVEFVQWTLIYLLWDTLSRFLINAVLAYGKIKKYQIILGTTKFLALPLTYIWLKLGGSPLVGIWVNIILELVCLFLRFGFNSKYISFPWKRYLTNVVFPCWFVFVFALLLSYWCNMHLHINSLFSIPLSLAITILTVYCLGLNTTERKTMIEKIQSYKNTKA